MSVFNQGKKIAIAGVLMSFLSVTACAEDKKMQADMIVQGDYLLTMEVGADIIEAGAVAIKGGKIIAVGKSEEILATYVSAKTISGTGKVLMPGLVNGHGHSAMTLFRGMADDLALMDWLTRYVFPSEGQFVDADFIRLGTSLACYEMIRSGTTSYVDMYFYPGTIADVVDKCGMRAVVSAPMIDFPSPGFKGWDDSFAAGVEFVNKWKGRNSRITPALAPHAAYTVSPEHLKAVASKAKELGVPISMHIAEDGSEVDYVTKNFGTTPASHADAQGLFDVPMIAAHMVWPTSAEIELMASKKVGAIHNPTSNLKLAAGISPVPEMIAKGMRVGLGTDGAASNNNLDMWEEVRLAALIHKNASGDPTEMPAYQALELATWRGAEAVGLGDVAGSLTVGRQADMIQIRFDSVEAAPVYNIVSHLVYVLNSRDVTTTIVDGKVLMQNGKVLTLDGEALRRAAQEKGAEIKAAFKAE